MLDQWWFHQTSSGLVSAVGHEVFHWGLGIGLIIIFCLLAFFSPVNKKYFVAGAVISAILLFTYSYGHHDEATVCEAKVKKIYLEAHPLLTSKNTARNWKLLPSWNPAASPHYNPVTCDGPFDTNCWGQY